MSHNHRQLINESDLFYSSFKLHLFDFAISKPLHYLSIINNAVFSIMYNNFPGHQLRQYQCVFEKYGFTFLIFEQPDFIFLVSCNSKNWCEEN